MEISSWLEACESEDGFQSAFKRLSDYFRSSSCNIYEALEDTPKEALLNCVDSFTKATYCPTSVRSPIPLGIKLPVQPEPRSLEEVFQQVALAFDRQCLPNHIFEQYKEQHKNSRNFSIIKRRLIEEIENHLITTRMFMNVRFEACKEEHAHMHKMFIIEKDQSIHFDGKNLTIRKSNSCLECFFGRDLKFYIKEYGNGTNAKLKIKESCLNKGDIYVLSYLRLEILKVSHKIHVNCLNNAKEPLKIISDQSFSIGKSLDNEYVFQDKFLSSHHAQIFKRGQKWYIKDLRSKNGTYKLLRTIENYSKYEGNYLHIEDQQEMSVRDVPYKIHLSSQSACRTN